jgi:hypothetical protein
MSSRISLATVASIGIFAFGLEPIVHEVLGHAVVCWLTGGKIILISSSAMQTASASRLVPAAGPIANIVFGLAALALLRALTPRRAPTATNAVTAAVTRSALGADANTVGASVANSAAAAHVAPGVSHIRLTYLFLYFFGFANLFLATGYILYSGLINFGDFAAVIAGLHPAWLYRAPLVIIGALGYRYGIAQAARFLTSLFASANTPPPPHEIASSPSATPRNPKQPPSSPLTAAPLSLPDARRIIHTACFAGGALFLLASCLNPISPSLILYDGLSGTIGLTLGFFLALTDLRQSQRATPQQSAAQNSAPNPSATEIPFNLPLTISATIFAVAFLIFMGHGISLP